MVGLVLVALSAVGLQADDWTTVGLDAQRSSWVRSDIKISDASVRSGEFQHLWRREMPSAADEVESLTGPVLLDFLISHRGFRSLAFASSRSGGVFAMDTDLARMEWVRRLGAPVKAGSGDCPGGLAANLSRPTATAMPSSIGFAARGRRTPAKSGVGAPGEGAVTLVREAPATPSTPRPTGTARTRPPAQRALRGVTLVHAISAAGNFHTLYVSNGRDHVPPIPFLAGGAEAHGLIVADGTAYVATRNGCGGVEDGVWALDLEARSVTSWKSSGGSIAGLAGVALDPEGNVYAATSDGPLVKLSARTLDLQSQAEGGGFASSPVVIDIDGKDHVVALARNGSLQVYDVSALENAVATTLAGSIRTVDTALASWRDREGTRWILEPSASGLTAWKLSASDGSLALEKGWESPLMKTALPPIIVNGVVFSLDGGDASSSARLYALEGATGRPIWDSGDSIQGPVRGHTLASGPGHVYLTAADGAIYGYGLPMEH